MKYFGTDGIRGPYGGPLLNEAFVKRVGHGLARFLLKHNHAKPITVVVGRDTRVSGPLIQQALMDALVFEGIHVFDLGVLPTPAVSMAVRDRQADLGVVITASHNKAGDNGIKLFDNRGLKFAPDAEEAIEGFIDSVKDVPNINAPVIGYEYDAREHYINLMRSLFDQGCLKGWKVALDTAHGATSLTTPEVLRHYGVQLVQIGETPEGAKINDGVGSEYPEKLAALVKENNAHIGIAHDGDGDRLVVCDEKGSILSGEEVIGILALHFLRTGRLRHDTVVTTFQSNFGLDRTIAAAGGRVVRTDIGDRNVLLEMLEHDYSFGGESSGHLIFRDHSVAGDGLLGALFLFALMKDTGKPLSVLRKQVQLFPQNTTNLRVAEKIPLEKCKALTKARKELDKKLDGCGRILVRYSGTEPKLRLLAEAETEEIATQALEQLIRAAQSDLTVLL